MSGDWTSGYVTEIEYTRGYYRELGPALLGFAALPSGVVQPDLTAPFTYLELGCGQGLSTALHAAALPQGRFYAADFNPTHTLNARRLAAQAGIGNVNYLERSFAELADDNLPEFDFIALHGVYSWISAENRAHIVEIIRRRLKTGGLVYLSYNCLPGWTAAAPLRRLMIDHAAQSSGPIGARVTNAVKFATRLRDAGARYFANNPAVTTRLDQIAKHAPEYLAHEYFNRDWALFYFGDVVADLAPAKLAFVGSVNIVEQLDHMVVPAKAKELYAEAGDPVFKEMLKDFLSGQQFRRDAFVRGAPRLRGRDHFALIERQRFALIVARDACALKVAVPTGEGTLKEAIYKPLLDALAEGPRTLAELRQIPAVAAMTPQETWSSLLTLVAVNYVAPALPREGEAERALGAAGFNDLMLKRLLSGEETSTVFASPVLGSGIAVDLLEGLTLAALQQGGEDPAVLVSRTLAARNQRVVKDGKVLETDAENQAEVRTRVERFRSGRLPVLRQLGVAA